MCSRSVGLIVKGLPFQVDCRRLYLHLEQHPAFPDERPEERVDGGGHGQAELVQDGRGLLLGLRVDPDRRGRYIRRHREQPLRAVALVLERLREVDLVELAAAAPPGLERGRVGRETLDEPVAHGVGGLEADMAALDLVGGAGRVVERRRADHVPDGLNRAAALGPAQLRHVPFEGDYQVLGVHDAPIVAVYRANDMAP